MSAAARQRRALRARLARLEAQNARLRAALAEALDAEAEALARLARVEDALQG